jgi:hypothetical protein
MSPIIRRIAGEALRYAASTQVTAAVVFHAGWLLLATATWGHASGGEGAIGVTMRTVISAFVWLGGVDDVGHGDVGTIMVVWAKLSLLVYLVAAALRRWRGERRPLRIAHVALLSAVIAIAGYTFALWHEPQRGPAIALTIGFSALASITTVWAVLVQRMAARVAEALVEPSEPASPRRG